MAIIKFDQGNGSTVDPYSSGLTAYSFGLSPNANVMSRAIAGFSNFNIPRPAPTKLKNIDVASNGSVSAIQTILDKYKTPTTDAMQMPEVDNIPPLVEDLFLFDPTTANTLETVNPLVMEGVLAGNVTDTPTDFTKTDTDLSIDRQIKQYEDTFEKRKAQLSIEMYGAPKIINNPDESVSLEYTPAEGRDYFGLSSGQVIARSVPKPAPGASFEELRRYRDALSTQLRVPQYNTNAFNKVWDDLGIVGIKKFQRDALAAQLYNPTQDSISFGNVSQKDLELMKGLMTDANVNGMYWQDQLDLLIQKAKDNPRQLGGGGGGGGGGSGSSVYTQVQYSNTSMAVARSTLTQILQSALGRIPTDSELSEFMIELGKAESQSPTTIVTNTNKVGSKTKAVSRTTPSTVDINDMALSFAKRIGGGGEYDENKAQYYLNLIAKQYGYGFGQG